GWLRRRLLDTHVLDAPDALEDPPDFVGLAADDLECVAMGADPWGRLAAGQRLAHLLREIGAHLAGHTDGRIDDLLDGGPHQPIIRRGIDTDPQLDSSDIRRLVAIAQHPPADQTRGV